MINLYAPLKNTSLPPSCLFCHHRLSVDFQELFNPRIRMSSNKCLTKIEAPFFVNGNYIMNCEMYSKEGFYKDILFKMKIIIPKEYPFVAPRIISLTKVVHPNIHMKTGEVAIAMLRETEWIPVLNLNFILFALELVIIQPNINCTPDCPQNQELLKIYQRDLDLFERLIQESKGLVNVFETNDKMKVEGEQQEEEKQTFMGIEKHLNQIKMMEYPVKPDGIIRSLKYDFEQHEPKKREILNQLTETLASFETNNFHTKKRSRDQENLINPFLKKVKISSV